MLRGLIYLLFIIVYFQMSFCFEFAFYQGDVLTAVPVTLKDLEEFAELYQKRPIKNNTGGMKSVGMFWTWFVVKTIKPDFIIESGVWKGQSTWLLEQAAPQAKIIAIDPNLKQIQYKSKNAIYTTQDFGTLDLQNFTQGVTLAFFDDHQNAFVRFCQAQEKGIKNLLFDDNYPVGQGSHLTLEHCFALTMHKEKAEFLKNSIQLYSILPEITGSSTKIGNAIFQNEGLGFSKENFKSLPLHIYLEDAKSYRWTTFVQAR